MKKELKILQGFETVSLQTILETALLDREDTKYLLNREAFQSLLPQLEDEYFVLETEGTRSTQYQTLYFDSPSLECYSLHQRGKRNRVKIRIRKYMDSKDTFLEVKKKNNKGRTVKFRKPIADLHMDLTDEDLHFINSACEFPAELRPTVQNTFRRITLLHKVRDERITFDLDLAFNREGEADIELNDVVIAELKQEHFDRDTRFAQVAKQMQIRPERVSKYCLGIALLLDNVKMNRMKPKLRRIAKLTGRAAS